jgi:hypothetical protein
LVWFRQPQQHFTHIAQRFEGDNRFLVFIEDFKRLR